MIESLLPLFKNYLNRANTPQTLKDAMLYSFEAGGKRLRPHLLLSTCVDLGGSPQNALHAMLAVELIHTYSLIHDDLPAMDNDDMRRGKPSCHKAFDEATAILAADAMQALAFEILCDAPIPEAHRIQAIRCLAFASGSAGMVAGQVFDMLKSADLEQMHRCKTGALFGASISLGALMAGHPLIANQLYEYGVQLGLAFQIKDDVLDATQTSQVLGKTAKKDLQSGKYTYVDKLGIIDCENLAAELLLEAKNALDRIENPFTSLRMVSKKLIDRVY